GALHQGLHGGEAAVDGGDGEKGPGQPAPEAPSAHGGLGLVQHPQKGALLLLGAEGFRQLQVPPGGKVQLQEAALLVVFQALNVAQVCFLSLVEVVEKAPQGHDGGGAAVGDGGGGVLAELLFRQTAALVGAKAALAVVVAAAVEL